MTIAALIIGLAVGLAVGALAVAFAVRDRLRAASGAAARLAVVEAEARALERRSIEAEAELRAERGTLDERVTSAVKSASTAAMKESSGAFLDLAQTKLDASRRAAARVARQGRNPGQRARERPQGGVRIVDRSCAQPARGAAAAPRRDDQSRHRAPCAARPRPLGRDPAPSRRRDGGDGAVLRLRRTADDDRRGRSRAATRRDRAAPRWEDGS